MTNARKIEEQGTKKKNDEVFELDFAVIARDYSTVY
jgi:hypothetical protein